jgi:hypothetical protein
LVTGGAAVLTTAITVGIPAWLNNRTEIERAKREQQAEEQRLQREQAQAERAEARHAEEAERERVRGRHVAARQIVDEIVQEYGATRSHGGMRSTSELERLLQRGRVYLRWDGVDFCDKWLQLISQHQTGSAIEDEIAKRLIETVQDEQSFEE